MNNQTFIRDCMRGAITRDRKHGNLIYRGGVLYSYGEHYPLAVKINGRWIVNDARYSNTTRRHICYAKYLADAAIPFRAIQNGWGTGRFSSSSEDMRDQAEHIMRVAVEKLVKLRSNAHRKREQYMEDIAQARRVLDIVGA
jgi:hypothetical protein